jgi:hypothetical protein
MHGEAEAVRRRRSLVVGEWESQKWASANLDSEKQHLCQAPSAPALVHARNTDIGKTKALI